MGDNFDTIIYIIITIVAFVISAIGKKKKKGAKRVIPGGTESPSRAKEKPFLSNLEQLLKEEIGIKEQNYQNEYVMEPDSNDFRENKEAQEEILDKVPEEWTDEKDDVPYSVEYEDTSEIFEDSIQKSDLTNTEEEPVIEDFNMRDAVIYSEILNRKEY